MTKTRTIMVSIEIPAEGTAETTLRIENVLAWTLIVKHTTLVDGVDTRDFTREAGIAKGHIRTGILPFQLDPAKYVVNAVREFLDDNIYNEDKLPSDLVGGAE